MNQKEISELRRRWRPEKCAVSRIYGCFVNNGKNIAVDLNESLGAMTQEESEKFLDHMKKVLSGTPGRNLIDIVFSTHQVADSEEHRLLSALRNSQLQDREARNTFYQKVIDSLDMGEDNYLLLLACDAYDVPRKGRDGEERQDESEETFTYFLCAVCPVRSRKVELGFFPGENEFHTVTGQLVCPPELGFLFPAFDDRSTNLYNALFYSRKPGELHQEFIDAVFHTEPPISAPEQRELFHDALSQSLESSCSVEVVQGIHEGLAERIARHKESRDPEPLVVTASEIGGLLRQQGVPQERVQSFQEQCGQQFGEGAALSPANLINVGKFELRTAQATVSVPAGDSCLLETRIIDGRKYILVPAEEDVEINGLPVRFGSEEQGEPASAQSPV